MSDIPPQFGAFFKHLHDYNYYTSAHLWSYVGWPTMDRVAAILLLLTVGAAGFIQLLRWHRGLLKSRSFVEEYRTKFQSLVGAVYGTESETDETAVELYNWLTYHVDRVAEELGPLNVIGYQPPSRNVYIPNYPVIVNTLPKLLNKRAPFQDIQMCLDILTRYLGLSEQLLDTSKAQLRNPLMWVRKGVQLVVLSPVLLLHWFELIGGARVERLKTNYLVKLISGVLMLIGLVGSVITITLGWDQFTQAIQRLLPGSP